MLQTKVGHIVAEYVIIKDGVKTNLRGYGIEIPKNTKKQNSKLNGKY